MKKILLILFMLLVHVEAQEIYATFDVAAKNSANLAFTASGTVDKVNVEIGSIVAKGDSLASLKSDDIRASLGLAKTALKYAKRDYARQLKVKQVLDQARLDAYAFKYENAKAQVLYQQTLLDKTILKAPFDGIIFEKDVEVGDAVSGMMLKTVLKIQSLHERKLILEFDQKYWNSIKVGAHFTYVLDGDTTTYEGTISKIYPVISKTQRKMKAEVPCKDFIVGLFGTGTIYIEETEVK